MSLVKAGRLGICLVVPFLATTSLAQPVIPTADLAKRGLKDADFPRTIKITDNVYTYEDFHAGPAKFTTINGESTRRGRWRPRKGRSPSGKSTKSCPDS